MHPVSIGRWARRASLAPTGRGYAARQILRRAGDLAAGGGASSTSLESATAVMTPHAWDQVAATGPLTADYNTASGDRNGCTDCVKWPAIFSRRGVTAW